MDTILISLLPLLVPFVFIIYYSLRTVTCPDCGETMPVFYFPSQKTRRMWRAGGYLCAQCGCETNMAGQKVTANTPPAPFPTLKWVMLAVAFLVGVGLVTIILCMPTTVAAPPMIAAPMVVELPVQAPAVEAIK